MKARKSIAVPELPANMRDMAQAALQELEPAGPPRSPEERRGLMLSARTEASRGLPSYYLVYFLLVDLLEFPSLGKWEKTAWTVPVRFRSRMYSIEHRKMGLGVFEPNLDPNARMSGRPSQQGEKDATAIVEAIKKAVSVAAPYFQWRAQQAIATSDLNVVNKNSDLFARYEYFRDRFNAQVVESKELESKAKDRKNESPGTFNFEFISSWLSVNKQVNWYALAAIEAFFSWTEHAFIHLAILQGKLTVGTQVAELAEDNWNAKFKAALDISDKDTKVHYDKLLDLRAQVRNFVAHGAFGKEGQAFRFHSGAGSVSVMLSNDRDHQVSFTGRVAFDEASAITEIGSFLEHLWAGALAPAKHYLFSALPSILSYATDGTYARAMQSEENMLSFVDGLTRRFEQAADMAW
ncbi:hypothetical protein [Achromobacter dolens]|uniref:hypothetical protein n=1 Tax=Achromobacter dolens TaxID=1287738 RepID=UPI00355915B8